MAEGRSEVAGHASPLPAFLGAALALAILLGASTGAWELFAMAFAVGPVLRSHLQLHAHVQILGFAGVFFAGTLLALLPRRFGAAAAPPRLTRAVLVGLTAGVFLRAIGQPLAPWPAGRLVCLLAGAFEVGGAGVFVTWALTVLARRGTGRDPLALHLLGATVWFAAAVAIAGAQALRLGGNADAELPAASVEPFYAIGLSGFALSFVYALTCRVGEELCGLGDERTARAWSVAALQTAGVLLLAFANGHRGAFLAGSLLVAASAGVFAARSGLAGKRAHDSGGRAVRTALAALALFAVVSAAAAACEVGGWDVHKFVWDGARHLFTMGTLTLTLLAAGLRMLPALAGRPVPRLRLATAALMLAGAAAFARALQIPVALGWGGLPLYRVAGTSGFAAFAALALYGAATFPATRPPGPPQPSFGSSAASASAS